MHRGFSDQSFGHGIYNFLEEMLAKTIIQKKVSNYISKEKVICYEF